MDHTRQKDILDPEEIIFPVTVIGAGKIGSFLVPVLAKMGCKRITVYDAGIIEDIDLPIQMYDLADIGRHKVDALGDIVKRQSGTEIRAIRSPYPNGDNLRGIVISGVGSTTSRMGIWSQVQSNSNIKLYIDARIGGDTLEVLTIRPKHVADRRLYRQFLFVENRTAELPSATRGIAYNGAIVAGIIASQVKKWIRQEDYPTRLSLRLTTLEMTQKQS